jgi:hypothetical protein
MQLFIIIIFLMQELIIERECRHPPATTSISRVSVIITLKKREVVIMIEIY